MNDDETADAIKAAAPEIESEDAGVLGEDDNAERDGEAT